MKRYIRPISWVATAAVAVVALAGPAQSAETLKAIACLQKTHDYVEAYLTKFVAPINAENGDVKVRHVGGPEVTPRQKQAGALKRGLVDMIYCPAAYYGGQLSSARVIGAHNRSVSEVRANGGYEMMQEAWGKGLNAHILAWTFESAQRFYVYTRFKPVMNTKTGIDLSGVKMRSTGLYKAFMKAMGATPVVISAGDVYPALERGVVQGLAWPWGSVAKYGWERFLKYRIEPSFFGATMLLLVNKTKFASLSAAGQAQLVKHAKAYEKTGDAVVSAKGILDDKKLKAKGVETIALTGDVRKAYLRTIYAAKWAENDKHKYLVDYKTLKSKLYDPDK
jgi:TRAP-type C4-dicarboxylate transport system substrate-binding protein